MKVWMYLRLVIGLLFRKRLHFILLTTIHRFKVDFSVFCSICLKSGNTKPLVAKWPCCFKDILSISIYIYIYIYILRWLRAAGLAAPLTSHAQVYIYIYIYITFIWFKRLSWCPRWVGCAQLRWLRTGVFSHRVKYNNRAITSNVSTLFNLPPCNNNQWCH